MTSVLLIHMRHIVFFTTSSVMIIMEYTVNIRYSCGKPRTGIIMTRFYTYCIPLLMVCIMQNKKSFIVAPYWIVDSLQRRGYSPSVLFDGQKLNNLLSREDIATLQVIQYNVLVEPITDIVRGAAKPDSAIAFSVSEALHLHPFYLQSLGLTNTELANSGLSTIDMYVASNEFKERIVRNLWGDGRESVEQPITIYDTSLQEGVIVLNKGFLSRPLDECADDHVPKGVTRATISLSTAHFVAKALVKALYVYQPRKLVARSGLLQLYINTLYQYV